MPVSEESVGCGKRREEARGGSCIRRGSITGQFLWFLSLRRALGMPRGHRSSWGAGACAKQPGQGCGSPLLPLHSRVARGELAPFSALPGCELGHPLLSPFF